MFLASEVPPGTGLGSSSTLTVAAVKAVSTARGQSLTKAEVARLATRVELEKMGMPIGYQDQYASAYGGLNFIEFMGPEDVRVTPIRTPPGTLEGLQRNLLLFFTGTARESSKILARQRDSTQQSQSDVLGALLAVRDLAHQLKDTLPARRPDRLWRVPARRLGAEEALRQRRVQPRHRRRVRHRARSTASSAARSPARAAAAS